MLDKALLAASNCSRCNIFLKQRARIVPKEYILLTWSRPPLSGTARAGTLAHDLPENDTKTADAVLHSASAVPFKTW
jgi:hypothetical protein